MTKKPFLKDPFIRIINLPESVQESSLRFHHDLQPSNKITLKLDVSWTCHSHIIGKSGTTIQPIVRKTGVSIHFPDGNKNSETNKSNQVSINSRGEELSGLEEARANIRELTPLIFTFALPAAAQFVARTVDSSFLILQVQNTYNVQAELTVDKDSDGVSMLFGTVKGTEWDAVRVKEATLFLLQNLSGNLANQMQVQLKIEISPQHHTFIIGRNYENLKKIMQLTSTKIVFPDGSDQTLPALLKYTVIISGGISNVYLARQNIIGSLPLVLMFDLLPEQLIDQLDIDQMMRMLDVAVIPRSKRADGRRSMILRCAERNASNLYQAWRLLTKSVNPAVKAKIPQSYHIGECILPFFEPAIVNHRQNCDAGKNIYNNNNGEKMENLNHERVRKVPQESKITFQLDPFLCNRSVEKCIIEDPVHQKKSDSSGQPSSLSSSLSGIEEFNLILDLIPDRRAPGCEKKHLEINQNNGSELVDYFEKRIAAAKAMKQPVTPKPRTPTSNWSGHGFSKSMPGFVINQLKEEAEIKSKHDGGLLGMSWGPLAWGQKSIELLLSELQLEQYIELFEIQGIDLLAFSKLTDNDLKEVGVALFGHRKKILMAIKNLNENRQRSFFDKL